VSYQARLKLGASHVGETKVNIPVKKYVRCFKMMRILIRHNRGRRGGPTLCCECVILRKLSGCKDVTRYVNCSCIYRSIQVKVKFTPEQAM
jgi:hypothetical protein